MKANEKIELGEREFTIAIRSVEEGDACIDFIKNHTKLRGTVNFKNINNSICGAPYFIHISKNCVYWSSPNVLGSPKTQNAINVDTFKALIMDLKAPVCHGVKLKPGMVVTIGKEDSIENLYVLFPAKEGLCALNYQQSNWNPIEDKYYWDNITVIRDICDNGSVISGKVLWKKYYEISKKEIAKKFDIPVDSLVITD